MLATLFLAYIYGFTQDAGVNYTQDQIETAQGEILKAIPTEVHKDRWDPAVYREDKLEYIRRKGPEFRRTFIDFARKMANPLPGCVDHSWEEELFLFRDEATIRKFVSKWFDEGDFTHYGRFLGNSGDPEVIRLMGPYLFDATAIPKHPYFSAHTDIATPKEQFVATRFIVQGTAIAACIEFPDKVRVWNRRLAAIGPPLETQLVILQRWWKDNEEAFKTREWDKVKPGVLEIAGMPKSLLLNPPVFDAAVSEPAPAAGNPAAAIDHPKPVMASPVASAAESSDPSSALLWTGAVAAVAALAGLLFFWKRRT